MREQNLARIEGGASARFIASDGDHASVAMHVAAVDDAGASWLAYPILASTHGGPLPVTPGFR